MQTTTDLDNLRLSVNRMAASLEVMEKKNNVLERRNLDLSKQACAILKPPRSSKSSVK
jgi:hypothetical protein